MKILLRQWLNNDAEPLAMLANNKNIADNLRDHFPHPYTLEDAKKWIAINKNKNPVTNFAIEADGILVGGCGMILQDDVYRRSAEIGYWIGEPFWGKGMATEAIKLLTEQLILSCPDIVRIYAEVFENNKSSMRVLEKNNFYLESIRQKAVVKNNRLMDDYVWVKLLMK
jgi:RimJ/RimL family protein N-acetyltransferase